MAIVTQAEFARMSNAGRSTVAGWIEKGTISGEALVRRGGKILIDADKAMSQIQIRRDVGQSLGNGIHIRTRPRAQSTSRPPTNPEGVGRAPTSIQAEAPAGDASEVDPLWQLAIENAGHASSEFDAGMVAAIVILAHQMGAVTALTAEAEDVPLELAYSLQDAVTIRFMELGELLLRDLPSFADLPADVSLPVSYSRRLMSRVDWDQVASERGERADPAAWDAAIKARRQNRP